MLEATERIQDFLKNKTFEGRKQPPTTIGEKMKRQLTAIIEREGNGYVSLCPELYIASQGETIEKARKNLQEALELFFETASREEIKDRLREEVYITQVEVAVG